MSAIPIDDVQGEIYIHLCTQIGHLFLSFATLEGVLATILKLHMAENICPDESDTKGIRLASAVYGSMRYSAARDTIKRIAATENPDPAKLEFLLSVFAQIGHVQAFRDMIAHQQLMRSSDRIDGIWRLSNMDTTKDVSKPLFYDFDMVAVNAASSDLVSATQRLGGLRVRNTLVDNLIDDTSPIPWRHKPSMLRLVPLDKIDFPQEPPLPR